MIGLLILKVISQNAPRKLPIRRRARVQTKNNRAKGAVSHASRNDASLAPTGSEFVAPTVPPPSRLREEARIQQEVQERLTHLADRAKSGVDRVKSQRGGSVDVFVPHRVRWPHEFVLSGQNKDRITYN